MGTDPTRGETVGDSGAIPSPRPTIECCGAAEFVELATYQRYAQAAAQPERELCCPSSYDPRYLEAIPEEVLQRDYGCGDPTPWLRTGERVLDLGSGAGKICFVAAQRVGPEGYVLGVDCNEEMLALARRAASTVAQRLGYANVAFRKGLIQDLRLDLEALEQALAQEPVRTASDWLRLRALEDKLRREQPLVADASVDCVVSSCVLNLVRPQDRRQLFQEMHRVLRPGGRAIISDIVADEDVPDSLQSDPKLWSGCIAGAFREDSFLKAFEEAGFYRITLAQRASEPWRIVEGIEFRSVTVIAYKGTPGPCLDRNQAVIYRGPFLKVEDDEGHVFYRGERMAVCDKTYHLLMREPYRGMFEPIAPRVEVPLDQAPPFRCEPAARRHPRQSKGEKYRVTQNNDACCGSSCC
ncbi:MAG: methyltransferase [Gemmataceae bacterium]